MERATFCCKTGTASIARAPTMSVWMRLQGRIMDTAVMGLERSSLFEMIVPAASGSNVFNTRTGMPSATAGATVSGCRTLAP
jgi:hypothetical protein